MTTDHRPVVVAVSEQCVPEAALAYAVQEAVRQGAPLELVHAYDVVPHAPQTGLDDVARAERIAAGALQVALERAAELVASRVAVRGRLVRLPVVRGIVEAAEPARLLVLERRDETRLARIATRSTTSGVAARTSVPVVVVPRRGPHGPLGRVVVGVDVPERSHAILVQALAVGAARGVGVRVVHTWWFPGGYDDLVMSRETSEAFSAAARVQVEAALAEAVAEHPGVPVEVEVRHARPADALVEASTGAALVVVGRHDPLVPTGSHLGPVARAVLREAACPVLLVAPHPHRAVRAHGHDQGHDQAPGHRAALLV
ncbi:universal stress protein [Nocardioides sp. KIGAM211]|uniref:Universal stress protein n=1 Tax=Nocardioides luti TaxID=2761101 RepID=A0A7X0REX7_9ACTN|nr:universal stress protein [Nocardioides luti]MBB6627039.1 universal stress protein [Nocardioides luti]